MSKADIYTLKKHDPVVFKLPSTWHKNRHKVEDEYNSWSGPGWTPSFVDLSGKVVYLAETPTQALLRDRRYVTINYKARGNVSFTTLHVFIKHLSLVPNYLYVQKLSKEELVIAKIHLLNDKYGTSKYTKHQSRPAGTESFPEIKEDMARLRGKYSWDDL